MHFIDCGRKKGHDTFEVVNGNLLPKITELEALKACDYHSLTPNFCLKNYTLVWSCSLCVEFEAPSWDVEGHLSTMYVFDCKRLFIHRMTDLS